MLTSVVQAVEWAITGSNTPGKSVPSVVALRVGSLSGADPEALEFAWPMAVEGTPVQGARLLLELVTAAVWCPDCEHDVEIDEFYALRCPICDRPTAALTRGREIEIAYLEVDVIEHG